MVKGVIKINKIILAIGCLLVAFIVWFFFLRPVEASQPPQFSITICHHNPGTAVSLTFNTLQAYLNHFNQPHSGSTFDTFGACPTASPTASPSASPSASPTAEPTLEPTAEPTVSPTEEPKTEGFSSNFSEPGHDVCQGRHINFAPTVIGVKRIDADSIWVKWSKVDEGINNYIVEYSLNKGFMLWTTKIENANEVELNFLPSWLPIWVRVAGTDNCVNGPFGEWIDP
jgi:hypothetical protein